MKVTVIGSHLCPDTLYALNKNKYALKMDLSKAKTELKEAEKQFERTHSAADGLKVELAQANYDGMVRNLKAVTTAARDTEKAISKVENQSGGRKSTFSNVATAIAASGIGDMAKELAWAATMSAQWHPRYCPRRPLELRLDPFFPA